jgi:hypothetical protein
MGFRGFFQRRANTDSRDIVRISTTTNYLDGRSCAYVMSSICRRIEIKISETSLMNCEKID